MRVRGGLAPLVLVIVGIWLTTCGPGLESEQPGTAARVLAVIDGDTLAVETDAGEQRVRLIGIDAPEAPHGGRPGQRGHDRATAFLERLVGGAEVALLRDSVGDDTDRYGRLLRHVILPDGRNAARELLAAGLVTAYPRFPFRDLEVYVADEARARAARRGLWNPASMAEISWLEAADHIGEAVRVRGTLVGGRCLAKVCFLNFHRDYKRHLSLVLFKPVWLLFPDEPDAYYRGREVVVSGRITAYRGRPQILLTAPSQIEFLPPRKVNPPAYPSSYR
ncbi:MAG: thermonuclease family protein [Acidobacteriota bacterium]|nr:thermonuclease family protein [Acidobacteriota bacterium]